jgi:hypothetical protein
MTQDELRKDFLQQLKRADDGLTARQMAISAGLDVTKTRHYDVLARITESNLIEKIDTLYYLTDFGATHLRAELQDKLKPVKVKKSNTVEKIDEIEDFETRLPVEASVSTISIDAHIDNMSMVRAVLTKSTQDIISQLKKPLAIENRELKIEQLRVIAMQLNCESACVLNAVAEDFEAL